MKEPGKKHALWFASLGLLWGGSAAGHAATLPDAAAIDREVAQVMSRTGANGLALAVIDGGQVVRAKAYGIRNARGEPLTTIR